VERVSLFAVCAPAAFQLTYLFGIQVAMNTDRSGMACIRSFDARHMVPHGQAEAIEKWGLGRDPTSLPMVIAVTDKGGRGE